MSLDDSSRCSGVEPNQLRLARVAPPSVQKPGTGVWCSMRTGKSGGKARLQIAAELEYERTRGAWVAGTLTGRLSGMRSGVALGEMEEAQQDDVETDPLGPALGSGHIVTPCHPRRQSVGWLPAWHTYYISYVRADSQPPHQHNRGHTYIPQPSCWLSEEYLRGWQHQSNGDARGGPESGVA